MLEEGRRGVLRYQGGAAVSAQVRVCGVDVSASRLARVVAVWLRVYLMCFQLVQLSCLAAGDLALWRGIWRRPVPSSRAGGDVWCCMRAVGCLGASFVWVGTQ